MNKRGGVTMSMTIQQQSGFYPTPFRETSDVSDLSATAEGERTSRNVESGNEVRPEQRQDESDGQQRDKFELSQDAEEIRRLQVRDREVRAHEAAHASVGGAYAGAPTYSFERGPDGRAYAVGGEVSIDVAPIAGDPQATLTKARQVHAAALAPAEPSSQDMRVAQRAQALEAEARRKLVDQRTEELKQATTGAAASGESTAVADKGNEAAVTSGTDPVASPAAEVGTISRLDIRA
jgi:hypothetical protein